MANSPSLDLNHTPAEHDELFQGRYALHEQLGRGHLATVYRADDTVLDRVVAVKILHPHICGDPDFVQQFLEMERRMARLFHPNLVTIFDAGAEDDGCYVVMEYVAGGSLRRPLERGRPLPTPEVLRAVGQVAEALQVLHAQGIVHGEIKPDNVLLDEDGTAKLVDFGIAYLASTSGLIRSDSLARTAPYLAPEQLETGRADARSDIYALGLLAYELLAGRQPFDGDTWIDVATRRLDHDPLPLEQLRPDLPPALAAAVMRAIARDPGRRFASAEELRAALVGAGESGRAGGREGERPGGWEGGRAAAGPTERTEPLLRRVVEKRPVRARRPEPAAPARRQALGERLAAYRPALPDRLRRLDPLTRKLALAAGLLALLVLALAVMLPRGAGRASGPAGPGAVTMPDLRGRPLETARQDLAALGLQAGKIEERETAERPRGTVAEQQVRAGNDLRPGATVDLAVAIPPKAAAPKLVDRPIGEAESELQKRGLRLAGVQLQPVAGQAAGTVLAQDPPADTQLRQGDGVNVTIAVPPQPK